MGAGRVGDHAVHVEQHGRADEGCGNRHLPGAPPRVPTNNLRSPPAEGNPRRDMRRPALAAMPGAA
jgi:hypothetical protein